jgi:hypothetical protein
MRKEKNDEQDAESNIHLIYFESERPEITEQKIAERMIDNSGPAQVTVATEEHLFGLIKLEPTGIEFMSNVPEQPNPDQSPR